MRLLGYTTQKPFQSNMLCSLITAGVALVSSITRYKSSTTHRETKTIYAVVSHLKPPSEATKGFKYDPTLTQTVEISTFSTSTFGVHIN